jgi:hypothetical protein
MLNMTGSAAWGGGLALDALGGFEFAAGETFDVATFAAVHAEEAEIARVGCAGSRPRANFGARPSLSVTHESNMPFASGEVDAILTLSNAGSPTAGAKFGGARHQGGERHARRLPPYHHASADRS